MSKPIKISRLRDFIHHFSDLLEQTGEEEKILSQGALLLKQLVAHDDWLPEEYAQPNPERYQQYLLHADSRSRFSVVSFVWGAGQQTPIHDHRVWGLIGVLRGAEISQHFSHDASAITAIGQPSRLSQGEVESVSPTVGDIHRVVNAHADRTSISIHVYGGNIGAVKRATYQTDGSEKPFISGYSNQYLPNIWDLSKEQHL